MKPLGIKSYGSIPHLPGSRLGPGDHHCHDGQARICTEKTRDRHDIVIVQEKLDGSNVGAAILNGKLLALTRAGYLASSSPFEQHWLWAAWVHENEDRFRSVLREGERICGEWLAQAHGTRYALKHEPFVAFDIIHGSTRVPFAEFCMRAQEFTTPSTLSVGSPVSVVEAMGKVDPRMSGAIDPIEGVVYRVERKGEVDFLAKYVRPDKIDGCYLGEGVPTVWNWGPKVARASA